MTSSSGTPAGRAARGRSAAVLLALGALVLAGCDDGAQDDVDGGGATQSQDDDASSTQGEGNDSGESTDGGDNAASTEGADSVAAPTEAADIEVEAADRQASQADGPIFVTGAPVAFTSPSGDISCVMTPTNATCQVTEKTYTPSSDQLVGSSIGTCLIEDADAMILSEEQGAWTCPPQPLAPIGALAQGGWWAEQIGADTVDVDGVNVAMLAYGNDLRLGVVTCSTAEQGVTCLNTDLGKQIFIARSSYRFG